MAKITRFNGNLVAPASAALGTERTLFGDVTQSDDLTDQFTADLLRGWGIVGPSDQPTLQDFNAMGFTLGQIHAYLHQMGVAEYNSAQEYHTGSISNVAGVLYVSLVDTNVGNIPALSPAQWSPQSEHGIIFFDSAGVTAWTVPPAMQLGIIKPKITLVAGGGGGARINTTAGGGGGAGGAAIGVVDLTGVPSVTITVGAGGAGATVDNTVGGNGGSSSFGAFMSATGGEGGNTLAAGTRAGGQGTGGDLNIKGNNGMSSYAGVTGTDRLGGGVGGDSLFGGRAGGAVATGNSAGQDGEFGSGGSGSIRAANGGSGGDGIIQIEW